MHETMEKYDANWKRKHSLFTVRSLVRLIISIITVPSVETLHGAPQVGEDKVRLSSKGESE